MKLFRLTFGICCLILGISSHLTGQNFWHDLPYLNKHDSDRSFISIEGFVNYGCDGVNNEFLAKYYGGGYMDSNFVEKSSRALLPSNRFGVSAFAGITYGIVVNDSTQEMLTVSALRRTNITGRFSDDAFHLAFQGNSRYKGEEADFSRTRFTSMTWSQLRIGYVTPHKDGGVAFAFSVLVGHRYNEANIQYGKLFTDSQAMFVDGSIGADYWASDTSKNSSMALNGWGTSVDITWVKFWQSGQELSVVKLDFIDFGFINWNNKTIHRYADTTFTYNGVDITDIFLDPDYVAEIPKEEDFVKSDTTDFHRSIFLPAVARGSYQRSFLSSRLTVKGLFAIPFWSEALPFGSVVATWKSPKYKCAFSGGAAYGGYSRLQVPVKVVLYMIKGFSLELGTTNALGFINPANISGGGAYTKLTYCF